MTRTGICWHKMEQKIDMCSFSHEKSQNIVFTFLNNEHSYLLKEQVHL